MAKSKFKEWLSRLFGSNTQIQVIEDPKDSRDNYLREILGERQSTFLSDLHSFAQTHAGEIEEYKNMLKDGVT